MTRVLLLAPLLAFATAAVAQTPPATPAAGDAAPTAASAAAERPKATSLDQLLEQVRAGNRAQQEEDARREAEFRTAKDRQKSLLTKAIAAKKAAEARSADLEKQFDANEATIPELQETLKQRMGTLGEIFGAARQVAGDGLGVVTDSFVSAQIPGRVELLKKLSGSKDLPTQEELRGLWAVIQQEMTETGKVTRFRTEVVRADGEAHEQEVVRLGAFSAISDGKYLQWIPETRKLVELARQPSGRHLRSARAFQAATDGIVAVDLDPSRGSLLSLLIQTPSLRERIDQGGLVGYVIICLGIFGVGLAVYRLFVLGSVARKVQAQMASDVPRKDNPLGRVLAVFEKHKQADVETLSLKLDEAILKETPALERGNTLVKVFSGVGPLLGLLGTVTGMVRTFQVITLFGTGDPKLMAGGISEALVTTVLGLVMAIPLLLLHSILSSRSSGLVQILDEQVAGIVAARAEHLAERKHAVAG